MPHSATSKAPSDPKKSSKGLPNRRQSRRNKRKLSNASESTPIAEKSQIPSPESPKLASDTPIRIPLTSKTTLSTPQHPHRPLLSSIATETSSFTLQSPSKASVCDLQAHWTQRKAQILTRLNELTLGTCTTPSSAIHNDIDKPLTDSIAAKSPQCALTEQSHPQTTPGNRRLLGRKRLRFGENPLLERGQYHRDYLMQEMEWMAADFAQEQKWKGKTARTLSTSLLTFHRKRATQTARKEKIEMEAQRRVAGRIARDIKRFWSKIDKLVQFQHKVHADQIRKTVMDRQLKTLVQQTEQYASALAATFQERPSSNSTCSSASDDDNYVLDSDDEKESTWSSDEGEIDEKEQAFEVKMLQAESELPIDQLRAQLPETEPVNVWSNHSLERPFLLTTRLDLREYQVAGVAWLIRMCEKRINGILADEMGLGKTIQTITLLAHLACEHHLWGPHLIIVPTSCLVNWEMELKRWCPAFKILTYFGSAKRRKLLRQGWSKPNTFHVCVTSYQLVVQDAHCFKRKKWYYVILDEAHHIKNWKSLRWQTLLTLHSQRRLLLTGTPLQNHILELWALMHFLMPHLFASRKEFTYWFQQPLNVMVEGSDAKDVDNALVDQLHGIIRPFVLRRLKKDVAKQLPRKVEHVIPCKLSRRQQSLYEGFLAQSWTRNAMSHSNGNFLSLMNILMQLRKVCNHPNLFQARPIASPLDMPMMSIRFPSRCVGIVKMRHKWKMPYMSGNIVDKEIDEARELWTRRNHLFVEDLYVASTRKSVEMEWMERIVYAEDEDRNQRKRSVEAIYRHFHRLSLPPAFGYDQIRLVSMPNLISIAMQVHRARWNPKSEIDHWQRQSDVWRSLIVSPEERIRKVTESIGTFGVCVVPKARARVPMVQYFGKKHKGSLMRSERRRQWKETQSLHPIAKKLLQPYDEIFSRTQLNFPDKKLIQFDCGKLQQLDQLLRQLRRGKHRCLIFTQMTSMLNILEQFLNLHGHTYFRLDGSTRVEKRQMLMEKFNHDPSIFCFILSTRSGGLGINLTGADTVIFYDSDWNPAMDAQAQDRAHRIGQTREVHIYRLVTESTVEENILRKAQQKRNLETLVMTKGHFTTEFFSAANLRQLVHGKESNIEDVHAPSSDEVERFMATIEDEDDVVAMRDAKEQALEEEMEFQDESIDSDKNETHTEANVLIRVENALTCVHRYALAFRKAMTPMCLQTLENEMETQAHDRNCDIERMEQAKALRDSQLIAQGDLIAGIDDRKGIESYCELFKRKRSDVHFERRKRQMTGAAWELMRCKDTHHRFYYNSDTKQAVWDPPSILIEMEQWKHAQTYRYAGLPSHVMLGILRYLHAFPDRIQSVRLVCRWWNSAANNMQLNRRIHVTDAWQHEIASAPIGVTLIFASGVYELEEPLTITRPIRLIAAHDAHVEIVMRSPRAQLYWRANGGLLQGFHLTRRTEIDTTSVIPWQHLVSVSGRLVVMYCDFDNGLHGNACIGVWGPNTSPTRLCLLQNRIVKGSTGIFIAKSECQVIIRHNTICSNRRAGIVIMEGHAIIKQNKITCTGQFGSRWMYPAGNVIVEDNVFSFHRCKSLDVEKSARRYVVRWNVGITRDQDERIVEPLPHRHGRIRIWTVAVRPRAPVMNLCTPFSMMQTLLHARMGIPTGKHDMEYDRILIHLQNTCECDPIKIKRPRKASLPNQPQVEMELKKEPMLKEEERVHT